jgi:NADH-quinone oxidoreductase subunit M
MHDLNRREWAALVPLIAMMVWMGVYTASFLPPVTRANAATLEQSRMNVRFHVALPPSTPYLTAREAPHAR